MMTGTTLTTERKMPYNIVLAIGGLNGFVSTEVQNSTSVLHIKFSAENPAHRQYARAFVHLWFYKISPFGRNFVKPAADVAF
jgi:hypothetical protein